MEKNRNKKQRNHYTEGNSKPQVVKEDSKRRFDNEKGKSAPRFKKPAPKPVINEEPKAEDGLRLNRYVANSGVCSRREADELIAKGLVTVNGAVVKELGTRVNHGDDVRYEGKRLNPEAKVYILINKPKDVVTTASDPEGRRTVMDIIQDACDERVYPVGRLDRNTTGLLLLTNDGDLSKKLTHPSSECKKIYHVYTDKAVTKAHLEDIKKGIKLDDGQIKADHVSYADAEDRCQVGIELHSGRNRIVRRIFEHLGYKVVKLDRVYFAGLTKKNLPRGKWRFLSRDEIKFLKAGLLK
ncbi:pseudouridine synthase [Alkaliflexus imshenetskii]|uniref:pseudouridine synthase n=1 Tax=Alkaliflexus imshenetskii TaxID=286730 RepID=UPI0004B2A5A3|nr:pseudouridine synthase [Alkaliflexus imshenetskii]